MRGAKLVVAILAKGSVDTGRALQNMLLVAWNEGVGSCPNGIADLEHAREALGLGEEEELAIVLDLLRLPGARDGRFAEIAGGVERPGRTRRPLDELVERR